ncbi:MULTISPECIES: VOC family protein [unclassified Shinella]|uniref:VOC family protein n=1 Tax=unclassified Shinella TaxID=2643062 RepID=UPI00234EC218|nr:MULTISPECIES: VOC family protein [unclassified Shinella]MDC7259704.1 VOC family protein [Shinella sp. YE25]MDC7266884.1 VOC family protein [Shinella sp. HY16]MDC7273781.1 VOC family protein [Shinella sp. YZ44]
MKLASLLLTAQDINGLVALYEMVTGLKSKWLAPVFAEIVTPTAAPTPVLFIEETAEPAVNRSAIIELQVAYLDAEFDGLKGLVEAVHPPKLLPWGNRTVQLREPEGTLISLRMPVTDKRKCLRIRNVFGFRVC